MTILKYFYRWKAPAKEEEKAKCKPLTSLELRRCRAEQGNACRETVRRCGETPLEYVHEVYATNVERQAKTENRRSALRGIFRGIKAFTVLPYCYGLFGGTSLRAEEAKAKDIPELKKEEGRPTEKILKDLCGVTDEMETIRDDEGEILGNAKDVYRVQCEQLAQLCRVEKSKGEFERKLEIALGIHKDVKDIVKKCMDTCVKVKDMTCSFEKKKPKICAAVNCLIREQNACRCTCSGGCGRRGRWLRIFFWVFIIALFITLIATTGGAGAASVAFFNAKRSEERRVGKEGRCGVVTQRV